MLLVFRVLRAFRVLLVFRVLGKLRVCRGYALRILFLAGGGSHRRRL